MCGGRAAFTMTAFRFSTVSCFGCLRLAIEGAVTDICWVLLRCESLEAAEEYMEFMAELAK